MDVQTVKDPRKIIRRAQLCDACEHKTFFAICGLCGCIIKAKIRLENQTCPAGKW